MYTHKGQFLKPLLKIIGGKQKSRDILYKIFPEKYSTYVEPFLGSASVLVGSKIADKEYVNDINLDIINFYRQVREYPNVLFELVQEHLAILRAGGKEAFYKLRNARLEMSSELERAAWLYLINKSCFNGIIRYSADGRCNSSYCGTTDGRGWFTREWLMAVSKRIRDTDFSSLDFTAFLRYEVGKEDGFIFLDPPYFLRGKDDPNGAVTIYNGSKFTTQDHEDLAALLVSAKAKWMLTINDCTWTRDAYKDFNIYPNHIFYSCSQTPAGRGLKQELIVTNYEIPVKEII